MESFEKIWEESDLDHSDKRLKEICEKVVKSYLLSPEIKLIKISKEGYYNSGRGTLTFDICYLNRDKEKFMQINYYGTGDIGENIPDSIAFD